MAGPQRKALDQPDETRQIDKGKVDVVQLASGTVMRTTFEPGWRWSESVQPMVGGDSCQVDHFGYCISGRLRIQMNDGQELDIGPGDVIEGVRDASFLHVATGSDQANRIETLPTCDP